MKKGSHSFSCELTGQGFSMPRWPWFGAAIWLFFGATGTLAFGQEVARHGLGRPNDRKQSLAELSPIPEQACAVLFEGEDENGRQRIDLKPAVLFGFTDAGLAGLFEKRDFITCLANLSSFSDGRHSLHLEIAIAAPNAPELFGYLPKGEFIELSFLKGRSLRLFNLSESRGVWEPSLEAFVFRAQFLLGGQEERALREGELDSVELRWSKVRDRYPVFHLDLLAEQLRCFDTLGRR